MVEHKKDLDRTTPVDGKSARNEGEGSRTAARRYNEKARAFAESGRAGKQAEEARRALEGNERGALERAESSGRSHAKDEDPYVSRRRS